MVRNDNTPDEKKYLGITPRDISKKHRKRKKKTTAKDESKYLDLKEALKYSKFQKIKTKFTARKKNSEKRKAKQIAIKCTLRNYGLLLFLGVHHGLQI
ncbi:hypothetical protein RirG_010460 [Rhizophagus irregularis DAOM 197198w]|uniref:Uncharacterized protein n=1 Tax=Rhizophagus irregularis (strain DAOM 197198w) TaxID=1432141 RepID=A0A015LGX5_RHIIW|nr:hypothetical protein RirG_010460 [Rhizophagus irregularis DAOM 197198w]